MLPRPALRGAHQVDNAVTAIAALERLRDFTVSEVDMANGLMRAEWPARMQRLQRGPLVELCPAGWELWLDGGHNAAAGEALAAHARDAWSDRPLYLVVGMLNSKQADRFLAALQGGAAGARCVAIPGEPASFAADRTAELARDAGLDAAPAASVAEAVADLAAAPGPARILVCGSLYLAGTVLSENG